MRRSGGHNLTFDIVQRLGSEIVSEKYSKGTKFPTEAHLCEEYGVSRSIMREAVKILTGKGLLTARPRRGTEVTQETNWNLLDPDVLFWLLNRELSFELLIEFTQIRQGFEPEAAFLAATNATEEQKKKLLGAIEEMERAARGESDALQSDIAFHISVLEASNNRFMMMLDSLVETALTFSIRVSNRIKGVKSASVADHRAVADAILAGDGTLARDNMKKMLDEAMRLFQMQADRPN
ncbi:MAG: FadR family transcriptional regulator [Alphaproteobacteria bacterium]|nr:FadR family transcriptional regulator [Alphaproteobacteria bacterium]